MQKAQVIPHIELEDVADRLAQKSPLNSRDFEANKTDASTSYLLLEGEEMVCFNRPIKTDYYSIAICLKGNGRKIVNGKDMEIRRNTLQFITPRHTAAIAEASPDLEITELLFKKKFIKEANLPENTLQKLLWIDPECPPSFSLHRKEFLEVKKIFRKISRERKISQNYHLQIIRHVIIELLFRINRIEKSCLHDGSESATQTYRLFREFRNQVEKLYKKKQSVGEYAEILNVTPKYLSEVIKKESGKTALQYIHQRIITEAKVLLRYTNRTSKEVAFSLGFNSPSHFSRFFKNKTGQSPSQFRRNRNI